MKRAYAALVFCLLLLSSLVLPVFATNLVVDFVSISGVDAPVAGSTLDYSVSITSSNCTLSGGHWAEQNGVYWLRSPLSDLTYGQILAPGDHVVEPGYAYTINVIVGTYDGWSFSDTVSATVNGAGANIHNFGDNTKVVSFSFVIANQKIHQVAISGLSLPTGDSLPGTSGVCSAGCSLQSIQWMDLNTDSFLSASEKMIEGNTYRLYASLAPLSGYEFASEVAVTLNGIPAESAYGSEYQLTVEHDFVAGPPVTPPATEPPATEPPATNPPATEPKVTEPKATEPKATEPKVTQPKETEPKQTQPEATEPKTTAPGTTAPAETTVANTEPEATKKKPAAPSTNAEATPASTSEKQDMQGSALPAAAIWALAGSAGVVGLGTAGYYFFRKKGK